MKGGDKKRGEVIIMYNAPKYKRKYNRKAARKKYIRVGTTVNTKRGIGIITVRDKDELWIAHECDNMNCSQYIYKLDDVELLDESIDKSSKFYECAWTWIIYHAMAMNTKYETERAYYYIENIPNMKGVKTSTKSVSTTFGSHEYLRLTYKDSFDFEVSLSYGAHIGCADRLKYAYALWNGDDTNGMQIVDINGHGWVTRREIKPENVKYGEAYSWARNSFSS